VHEDNPPVSNVFFSPNGKYVLAWSLDSSLRLWDYKSGSVKKTYQGHKNKDFSVGGCFGKLTDDEDDSREPRTLPFIASASDDGDIVMWDVVSKEIIQRIPKAHDGVCFSVDIHDNVMVSAGNDGLIRVYHHKRKPRAAGTKINISRTDKLVNGANGGTTHAEEDTTSQPSLPSERVADAMDAAPTPSVNGENGVEAVDGRTSGTEPASSG
jgi:COMPASS component SWD3